MLLKIVKYGNPVLRLKGEIVSRFDDSLAKLSADMLETMRANQGIGLAAQQVGIPLQFFVVEILPSSTEKNDFSATLDGKPVPPEILFPLSVANPEVEILPDDEWLYTEGCLSFPNLRGSVARREKVRLNYQDLRGGAHEIVCDNLLARCIQHEFDHCQGVLFIDRMEKRDLLKIQGKVKRLYRETRDSLKT
ncbi:MAG: peptide deformylase [Puniceicoccales bacterium]|jgi:peptide deformylase|nr:peptide deformylase [Puniceicoccales bacterium]